MVCTVVKAADETSLWVNRAAKRRFATFIKARLQKLHWNEPTNVSSEWGVEFLARTSCSLEYGEKNSRTLAAIKALPQKTERQTAAAQSMTPRKQKMHFELILETNSELCCLTAGVNWPHSSLQSWPKTSKYINKNPHID